MVLTNGATLGDDPFGRSPWRREPLGALWDLGPHALAWLHLVLGPTTAVTARHAGHETVLDTTHASGATARTVLSVASPEPQERFVLRAADGGPTRRRRSGRPAPRPTRRCSARETVDDASPTWRAVADPRFSTAVVATLVEAAAQLEG